MRKTILSAVAIFAFMSGAFVQQASATSPPDLTGTGWEFQDSRDVVLNVDGDYGESWSLSLEVKAVAKYYVNATSKEVADVLELNGQPVSMIYRNAKDNTTAIAVMAIRVDDKWLLANKPGVETLVVSIVWGVGNKPAGLRFSLDTTAGAKQRLIPIQ